MLIATLHSLAPLPGPADAPPEWVQLLPAGTVRGRDGRGPYVLRDAAAVIAASLAEGPLALDENHATDRALQGLVAEAPARGWIVQMEARADGIWGRVEWTPSGRALMADRAYRGISPVIAHAQDGTVRRVLRAALTNAPNLPLATLHTQESTTVDLARLRRALGLADDADEAAILAAAETAGAAVATHARQLGAIARAAGLAEGAAPDAITTALQARAAAGDPAQMARDLVAMQAQLTALNQANARAAAEAAVDGAIRAGKPIPASLRDHYIARHMQDPTAVKTELDGLPSLHAGGLGHRPPAGQPGDASLSADEQHAIALLGISAEDYRKQKAREGALAGRA